jgi:MtN3 and saliva related transmembrane protein
MIIENIIGITAAIIVQLNLVLQIIKSYKTKKVNDLSILIICLYLVGSFLWLIYGMILKSFPIILSDSVGTLTSFYLLIIKIKYDLPSR